MRSTGDRTRVPGRERLGPRVIEEITEVVSPLFEKSCESTLVTRCSCIADPKGPLITIESHVSSMRSRGHEYQPDNPRKGADNRRLPFPDA